MVEFSKNTSVVVVSHKNLVTVDKNNMTSAFTSLKSTLWGSSAPTARENETERDKLAEKLIASGVKEEDARQAAKTCPVVLRSGEQYLLLQYMIDFGAKEAEAVEALFLAKGDPHETILIHEKTFLEPRRRRKAKHQKMVENLMEFGIDQDEAKKILKSVEWNMEKARVILLAQQEREMKIAKRAYLAKKEKVKKLASGPVSKATKKVHRATSGKKTKQSRYVSAVIMNKPKSRRVEGVLESSDSEEDIDDLMNTVSIEEEETSSVIHSNDESDMEMKEEELDSKPPPIFKAVPVSVKKTRVKKMQSPAVLKAKANTEGTTSKNTGEQKKNPSGPVKLKIFQLRRRISVPMAKSLWSALVSAKGNAEQVASNCQTLKSTNDFHAGPSAEILDLLIQYPSLLHAVIKTLEEKVENKK